MTETKLSVKFKRLHPEAIMPRYQTDGEAGFKRWYYKERPRKPTPSGVG